MDSYLLLGKIYNLILKSDIGINRIEKKSKNSIQILLEDNYLYKIKILRKKNRFGNVQEDIRKPNKKLNRLLLTNSRRELESLLHRFAEENAHLMQILVVCMKLKEADILTDYDLEYILREVELRKDKIKK